MSGESDFEKTLASIGGKEKIYLVSDAAERNKASESDADVGYGDKPPKGTPDNLDSGACPGGTQRTVIRQSSSSSRRRTIDCPAIVFLFRQTFISSELCLKEVLKDVKARTNRASGTLPALIGLVRITAGESDESRRCVQRLEMLIRKVFPQHPADTVWVASFLPGAPGSVLDIKKNVCRVIACSQTTGPSAINSLMRRTPGRQMKVGQSMTFTRPPLLPEKKVQEQKELSWENKAFKISCQLFKCSLFPCRYYRGSREPAFVALPVFVQV
uniref:C2orf72-like C-terminal domain-containing protein n=1 Tax=Hippocampus comes TaxID=109280 RepID=A0A3Q2XUM2_HIPCM